LNPNKSKKQIFFLKYINLYLYIYGLGYNKWPPLIIWFYLFIYCYKNIFFSECVG
jgi:hypothetical protein